MLRKAAREAAVLAFYLALAIAMTWPLAANLSTALSDLGDPFVNMWIVDWVAHALTHQPLGLFDSPLYHPGRLTLAYSENLIGVALFVLPFHLAGVHPIAVYNLAMLLGFAFSGYGMFVLARLLVRSSPAAMIGGLLFAFVPFRWDHLSHMQLQWSGWMPLLLAAVIVYWRTPSNRTAALVIGAFVMNGLTNIHYLLFGSFAALVAVLVLATVGERRDRRFWLRLAAAFAIGGLLLLPVLLPYRAIARDLGAARTEGDAISGSAPLVSWLIAPPRSVWYGELGPEELHRHEMQLFPGLVAIFLALVAVVRTPRRDDLATTPPAHLRTRTRYILNALIALLATLTYIGAVTEQTILSIFGVRIVSLDSAETAATLLLAVLVIRFRGALRDAVSRSRFDVATWAAGLALVIGVLGSLGMKAFMHAFLFRYAGPFQAVRAPVRWAMVAYIGLALWAALGARTLLGGRRRHAIAALLVAAAAIDLWPTTRWEHANPTIAPVYRWLARERVAPLIELPTSERGINFQYLLGSTVHRLPQLNGIENMGVPDLKRIRNKGDALEYDDEMLDLLERNGTRLVVVHAHAFGGEGRAWLARQLEAGRLAFVRSFDHAVGGDFVFAVTKNLRDWQRLVPPPAPDGAGHLPSQRLERMLRGQPVHSDATMVQIESPAQHQAVKGEMLVRGWTLAPFAIRRVTVRIDSGRVQLEAPLVEREDIKSVFHWYYFVPKPGFHVVVPKRPDGVSRYTDVQVEVEDAEGRVVRSEDVLVEWD